LRALQALAPTLHHSAEPEVDQHLGSRFTFR
jgi:hypothetical protein